LSVGIQIDGEIERRKRNIIRGTKTESRREQIMESVHWLIRNGSSREA